MSELLGYKKIEEDILKSLEINKLHHALIFSGVEGIGKFSFSKILAQKITNNFCEIKNNPDILLIKRELNQKKELKKEITIDSIRKINDFVNLTSSTSKFRIIIIDSIDVLNKNSANALLKNLEEPPQNIFFLLTNHNESNIPDTIKSRCNIIKVNTPKYDDFCEVVKDNSLNISETELRLLFEISNGSIALALKFYQGNSFEIYQNILKIITNSNNNLNSTKFIEELLKNDPNLNLTKNLFNIIFNRIAKAANAILNEEFCENEGNLLGKYLLNNNLDDIFKKNYEINNIFNKTTSLNLDKKQSLINILNIA